MEIKDKSGKVLIVVEGANLRNANLRYADLWGADLWGADLQYADLRNADLRNADLQGADLQYADLRYANLRNADLRDADLDFSVLFFGCESFDFKVDKRIMAQIAYHFCRIITEDEEAKKAQKYLKKLANQFHRVEECGKIK